MSDLKDLIRTIPDYPKKGILFRDVTTLFNDPAGFRRTINAFVERYTGRGIDKVAGIEARGFIVGAPIAHGLGAGFVPLRKKGKLPGAAISQEYALEYGTDHIELHVDALKPGDRVLLVDDLIATGGTAGAGIDLLQRAGGVVVEAAFIVDLPDLEGRKRIESRGVPVFALLDFAGH